MTRNGEPIKFTPKCARKFFTSVLALRGTGLPVIKRMVGHSPNSRVTERHYIHFPDAALKAHILELPEPGTADSDAPDLATNGNRQRGD